MKKEWRKKAASLLLCIAVLSGSISTDTFAATVSGNSSKESEDISAAAVSGNDSKISADTSAGAQYHLIEEDQESVAKWLELYCPGGFEDLLSQDQEWWDNLYDYESEYAEFLIGLIVELPEDAYDEQDISECIRILDSGVDADAFFEGTIFQGLTVEDLRVLRDADRTLEELTKEELKALIHAEGAQEEPAEKAPRKMGRAISSVAEKKEEETAKELMANVQVTATSYSGTGHGRIYRITLGGVPALCVSFGKSCRRAFLYHAEPGTYDKKAAAMGYFARNIGNSGAEYVACQIAAWLYLENGNLSETNVKSRAQAMLNISSPTSLSKMTSYVWNFYSGAKSSGGTYYEYHSDNESAQILITGQEVAGELYATGKKPAGSVDPIEPVVPEEPEIVTISETAETAYGIEIYKRDWQTGVGLAGCEVKIFENGAYLATVTTDEAGHAEYSVVKSAEFSTEYDGVKVTEDEAWALLEQQVAEFTATPYTYSVSESKAPTGYVWEANEKSESITGDDTAVFELTNERTLGAVELNKYDVESESDKAQGNAGLDGAVYGIYAAAAIYHQDKKSGILFQKDQLVQTAVTGKTPRRDADGYILNTDGSRHIAEQGKEIAYVDTPGKTLFGDLELGSYYMKEITPSEGYMLDEAVYPATFTYKNQMVTVEKRNETAGQADNELTADDSSRADSVYSGDYVNKQGIQFLKTTDNGWQTELEPIAGAGFSVYLINELSGAESGQIEPMGKMWTADDIQTFYDYDFTGEKTATVYKRTGHETWTEGDKLWLEASAGQNEYHVKEMFTDRDGYIETPELPYGTYVVVETTTPEYHTSAKPFIVSITGDGGVLYKDQTKKVIEKTYEKEEGIRYGNHSKTKEREGRVLQKQRIINNMITQTYLRVLKTDEEFTVRAGTYISAEEFVRGTVLKEGAKYRLKCTTLSLSRDSLLALNWKFDGEGYLSFYEPSTKTLRGTAENPFTTRFLKKNGGIQDCYVMLPQEIPVGTYELEEVEAPEGYVVNGWEQFVQDNSTDRVNRYEIVDTPFPRVIFTINNGAVYPDGQMGTNKYALADAYGNLTVSVLQENQEQKGILEITKHGEQLSGFHESAEGDIVFTYEDAPVEGAAFAVVAAEDIYTQEVQGDLLDSYQINKEQYLIHKKGEVVATITTDRNGWGYAADLYIGKYKVVETTAGEGFVLNTTETEFEITKQDQTLSFDIHAVDYKNERQKLQISVRKQDRETGESLAGAVYGLYAQEDIMIHIEKREDNGKWITKDAPETLCPADMPIATCITGKDGEGVFDTDLPLGKYYVRELEAPAGYLTAADDVIVNGSYDSAKGGQNAEKQEHYLTFSNRKTQAVITKRDLTSSEEIAGATLEIKEIERDEAGNLIKDASGNYITKVVASWVSKAEERHLFYRDVWGYPVEIEEESKLPEGEELMEKNGHLITGLELNKVYLLSEKEAPDGYGYAEDIIFKLVQEKEDEKWTGITGLYVMDNDTWCRAEGDLLAIYDEKKALEIEKSTIRMTQQGDTYRYTVGKLRNLTGETLEQFTMTDHLPDGIYLTELWTGTYSESLLYDAEYMTNKSEGWILWESGLSTEENHHLQIPEELRTKEEHVTKFRLCFGTVGGSFTKEESPTYMTYVSSETDDVICNEIELTALFNGKKLRDKGQTETVLYLKWLSGYRARGGGSPLYEIVDASVEGTEKKIQQIRSLVNRTEGAETEENKRESKREKQSRALAKLEDEEVPLGILKKRNAKTGDDAPLLLLKQMAVMAFTGIVILRFFGRKKKKEQKAFGDIE